eukprot:gene6810-8449_t
MFSGILISGLLGLLPYLLEKIVHIKESKKKTFLSFGNCVVAGVFISVGFIHLLPESAESIEAQLGDEIAVPLPFLLCPFGFFLVFFLEKVINIGHEEGGEKNKHSNSSDSESENDDGDYSIDMNNEENFYQNTNSSSISNHNNNNNNNNNNHHNNKLYPSIGIPIDEESALIQESSPTPLPPDYIILSHINNKQDDDSFTQEKQSGYGTFKEPKKPKHKHHHNKHHHADHDGHEHHNHLITGPTPVLLIIILSIHSVISGFSLGLENEESLLYPLFIGIISHKWLEAISLGISLMKAKKSFKESIKYIASYSLTEPIGMIIGGLVSYFLASSNTLATAFVISFSSGTFIYIGVMDILVPEFSEKRESRKSKILKFIFFLVGFAAMTCLTFAFDSEHDH